MKENWVTLDEQRTFAYGLPEEHLLRALRRSDTLLLQRITTQAVSLGRFLVNVLIVMPIFWFFGLMPLAAIVLGYFSNTRQLGSSLSWLLAVSGIAYVPALLLSIRRQHFLKSFQERFQYVSVKTLVLDFRSRELRVEEHFKYATQRNFRFVLDCQKLHPKVEVHLHDPDSDVDLCDEMRVRLGAPRGLRIPNWAANKLEEPVYSCSFDNTNSLSRMACEKKVQSVVDLLVQRFKGEPSEYCQGDVCSSPQIRSDQNS